MIEKNKGGRPLKGIEIKRNKRVSVNFTPSEYERAQQIAKRAKMPLSALLRKNALGEVVREPNFLNEEFLRYLASIASNVNQIAHACNSGRVGNGQALFGHLDKVMQMLSLIREEMNPESNT